MEIGEVKCDGSGRLPRGLAMAAAMGLATAASASMERVAVTTKEQAAAAPRGLATARGAAVQRVPVAAKVIQKCSEKCDSI